MPLEMVTVQDGDCVDGPCVWPTWLCEPPDDDAENDCYTNKLDDLDAVERRLVLEAAATWLYNATGRVYSQCERTIRPCRQTCDPCSERGPYRQDGVWKNGCLSGLDDCCGVNEVILPGPVCEVTEVRIDGVVRDPREYRVDNRRRLVRVGEVRQLPTDVGIGLFLSGAGLVGPTFPAYCNVTPTPDTVAGFDPLAGGCYTVASTTQSLQWTSVRDVTVSYEENDATPGSRALVVGDSLGGDQYQFPTTALTTAGQSMVSTARGDGTYARVTKVSGPGTIQRVGNPLILTGDVRFRVEILREELVYGGVQWPDCQELEKPSTEEGTFSVTYTQGLEVPAGGQLAAGQLAAELARACVGDPGCRLPTSRLTTLSRQGVTVGFDLGEVGSSTGIFTVDGWVENVLASRRLGALVMNPQSRGRNRRTTSNG